MARARDDGGPWVYSSANATDEPDLLINRVYFNRRYVVHEVVRRARGDKPGWFWLLHVSEGSTDFGCSGIRRSPMAAKRELARCRAIVMARPAPP